ncbi:integrase [Bacillus subtilis]|nr:integrase [Bacillus sp. SN1]PSI07043.1 integrase [Bacillus subtilis]
MNFVQPICDPECIFYIKRFLKKQNMKNYMLFVTSINSGLRISDILQLRVRDAKRPYFNLIEKKTKKKKRIDMTPENKKDV